jgi:hypothetical protein
MIPIELTDTELDEVCGGIANVGNLITQLNVAVPIAEAHGGSGTNSFAAVAQFVGQLNFSA